MTYTLSKEEYDALMPKEHYYRLVKTANENYRRLLALGRVVSEHKDADIMWAAQWAILGAEGVPALDNLSVELQALL